MMMMVTKIDVDIKEKDINEKYAVVVKLSFSNAWDFLKFQKLLECNGYDIKERCKACNSINHVKTCPLRLINLDWLNDRMSCLSPLNHGAKIEEESHEIKLCFDCIEDLRYFEYQQKKVTA